MEGKQIDEAIIASLEGRATTNDIELLRKWMSESDNNQVVYERMKSYWEFAKYEVEVDDLDSPYRKLKLEGVVTDDNQSYLQDVKVRSTKKMWFDIAASIVVICVFFGAIYRFLNTGTEQTTPQTAVIVKQNPKGQKLTTYLPDGSKVILNSLSSISYSFANDAGERAVTLEGEAYFEVKRDTSRNFKVISGDISTIALGTSFNVNTKIPDRVEVVLVKGSVKVESENGNSILLEPGELGYYSDEKGFEISDFVYEDKLGWKDGVLAFENNSLSEIFRKLEDWYGVEIYSTGLMNDDFHYSGKYKNESLEEVLHGISFVHQFDFEIVGDTVKIEFKSKNKGL